MSYTKAVDAAAPVLYKNYMEMQAIPESVKIPAFEELPVLGQFLLKEQTLDVIDAASDDLRLHYLGLFLEEFDSLEKMREALVTESLERDFNG